MSASLSAIDAKRAARNVSALIAASILSNGIMFVGQLLMTAWLGPYLMGIYGTVLGLLSIVIPLSNLSMGLVAIREIAQNPEKIGQYASTMLFSQTILSGIAYLVLVFIAYPLSLSQPILVFSAIAGINLLLDNIGSVAADLLKAQEEMALFSVIEIAQNIIRVVLSILLLWLGWSLLGVYAVNIGISSARAICLWWIHARRGLKLEWPLRWREISRPLLLNAWPLAASSMIVMADGNISRILLVRFLNEENAGYFGLAHLIHYGVIELLSTTVLVAMFPLLSRYYGDGKNESFGYLSEALSRFMLLMALPISLVLSIFSAEILGLISTSDFSSSIGILQIYIWFTFFRMLGNVLSRALLIQNRQRYMLMVRVAALVVNIGLTIVLLTRYPEPRMAAIAAFCSEALVLLLLGSAFRANGFVWRRALTLAGRILLIGAVAGLAMFFLGQVYWLIGLFAGAAIYLLGLRFGQVFSEEDLDLLYRLLVAMPFAALVQRVWKRETVINF